LDFWLYNDGGLSDFSVQWNAVTVFNIPFANNPAMLYTEEGPITLASTGSDTLTFSFRQDPHSWGLDDISVVPAIPEPSSILLLVTALGGIGMGLRRKFSA
jgi:hypothetical protein